MARGEIRGIPDSPRSGRGDPAQRRGWRLHGVALLGSLALAGLLMLPTWLGSGAPARIPTAGEISDRDHKAPRQVDVVDEKATEALRRKASEAAPVVYDFDARRGPGLRTRVYAAFSAARTAAHAQPGEDAPPRRAILAFRSELGEDVRIDEEAITLLEARGFRAEDAQGVAMLLAPLADRMIVDDAEQLARNVEKRHVVLSELDSDAEPRQLREADAVLGAAAARELVSAAAETGLADLEEAQRDALRSLALALVRPNLVFNLRASDARRQAAEQGVKPVVISLRQGEIIVRDGDPVTERHVVLLRGIHRQEVRSSRLEAFAGTTVLLLMLFHAIWRFGSTSFRKFPSSTHDAAFLLLTLIAMAAGSQLMIYVLDVLADTPSFAPLVEQMPSLLYFGIPVAAATMLVRIVHNAETALPFAMAAALVAGLQVQQDLGYAVFTLAGSLTAAVGAARVTQRGTLLRAGGRVALVNVAVVTALCLLSRDASVAAYGTAVLLALLAGAVSGVIVSGVAPAVEWLFNYTTDIKLLELANRENSLLRDLEMRAPGTYHHSMMVGHLAERAAEAIGANALEVRVAAYYHDIGKIRRPQFFVENVSIHGGENRHERLAPSMSARIIQAHVKDGAELGEANKLAEPILRGIRQHHGTSIIRFFYEKAKELADPEKGQSVNEHDYRYPGPKPQTREAGILMLADSVEAASRTLADTSPARVQQLVQRITNNYFRDGQLDECSLTLRDLHAIARTFIDTLSAIRHERVDYPEATDEKGRRLEDADEGVVERIDPRPKDRPEGAAAAREDDLRRLGLP